MKQDGSLTLENRSRTLPQTTDCDIFFGYPYGQRQFSAKQLNFFGEDHSGNLASLCRNESIQVKDSSAVQVDLVMKVIYENTIAWYTCIEIINCHIVLVIVYITVMKMPAVENKSLENIPDSEQIRSSVMDEEEVPEQQHSLVSVEDLKARDTKGGQRFLLQPSDIQSHTMKVSIQHNPTRKFLEWFDGGGNTPFHISGKLLEVFTALSNFVPYCSSVIRKCLSTKTKDLNIFTYFTLYWLRMYTITHDLLKQKCSKEKKLCSRKAGTRLTLVDTNKKDCIFEEQMSDQNSNMMEQKRHSKGRGKVRVMYKKRSKAVHRTDALMSGAGFLSCFKISKIGRVLMLLLVFLAQTAGGPVRDKDKRSDSEMLNRYFPLLTSDWCKNPEIKHTCPDSDSVQNYTAQNCEYACKTHENLTCLNSDEGAVYFCIPKSTRCDPGIFWQVEHTNSGMVVINESLCPQGFYQTKESKCFNACTARHFQLHLIPEMFKVYRKGDHFHPTILICDYTAGFYNENNQSFVNYDDSFIVNQDFCTHINVSNPCAHGQMPLYNRTCVDNCRLGFLRDEHDYFCKQVDENSVEHIQTSTQAPTSTQSPAEVSKLTTQSGMGDSDETSEKADTFPWYMYVVVAFLFILLIGIILLLVKVYCIKNGKNESSTTYQIVRFQEDPYNCISNGTSSRSSARRKRGERDDSAKDTAMDSEETLEKKILESSDLLNDDVPDVDAVSRKDVLSETDVRKTSVSSLGEAAGTIVKKTVRKKTEYKGNIMIRIKNIGSINIDKVEDIEDLLCQLSKELGIPVSKLIKQNDTDADLGETENKETDICDSRDIHSEGDGSSHDSTVIENPDDLNGIEKDCDQQESDKDEEIDVDVTNAAVGRLAGQEFSKPYNNAMTQLVINAVAEYMKSVGALIFNGQIIGTVFRAGDNCVITAFHVIQGIIDPERSGNYDFALLESETVFVTFSASVCETAGIKYRVCHRLSSNDPRLDYAVLEVTDRTDMLPKKLKLDKGRFERLQVNLLSGIGYGNPSDIFSKTFDPNCPVISSIDQKIADCQNWLTENLANISLSVPNAVNIGYDNIDKDQNIFLDISMRHRGSGSPFLTNEGFVVGMLTHGHPEFYFRLPENMQSVFPADKKFESLLRLQYMFLDIQSRDPTLANELF